MTKPKGRRVAAAPGSAPKRRKNARDRTAAATLGVMMKAKESRIGVREAACDGRDAQAAEQQSKDKAELVESKEQQAKKAAELDEREAGLDEREEQQRVERATSGSLTAREVEVERREAACDRREREADGAKEITREQCARREAASSARNEMGHRSGALLNASQSQDILLLYFGLVQDGMEENPAAKRTEELMRVGKDKVYKIRAHWYEQNAFLTSSGEGRGAVAAEDGRRLLNSTQCAKLRAFISAKHESGQAGS